MQPLPRRRSMDRSTPKVETLGPADAVAAAAALTASYLDYPIFRYVFRDDRQRRLGVSLLMSLEVRDALSFSTVFGIRRDGALVAVAVSIPPRGLRPTRKRQWQRIRFELDLLRRLPGRYVAYRRWRRALASVPRPRFWYWQLVAVGVRPEFRRRGLGSLLVEHIIALGDRDGIPCFTATSDPRNLPYYRSLGFAVDGPEIRLGRSGPVTTRLLRLPTGGPWGQPIYPGSPAARS